MNVEGQVAGSATIIELHGADYKHNTGCEKACSVKVMEGFWAEVRHELDSER